MTPMQQAADGSQQGELLIGDDAGPAEIFRHLKDWTAAVNHMDGELWLKRIEYFRGVEDTVRRDKEEGNASGQVKNSLYITYGSCQPKYILCFTEKCYEPKFGCHTVVLRNKGLLRQRVLDAMPCRTTAYWGKVRYSNERNYEQEPTPGELADRAEFTKPTRFADEREWRLVVRLPPSLRILNACLQIDVRACDDLFHIQPRST